MTVCVICGKPAKARRLCDAHYDAAMQLELIDKFPKLPGPKYQDDVRQYLKRADGGSVEDVVERQAKCPKCGDRFLNLHGVEVHIGRIHKRKGSP